MFGFIVIILTNLTKKTLKKNIDFDDETGSAKMQILACKNTSSLHHFLNIFCIVYYNIY